jgi:hypothetical protein
MAVTFTRDVDELVRDLQQRGLKPAVIKLGGEPARAAELRVTNNLIVYWDGDSRCVWVEGPDSDARRLEASIGREFRPDWLRRAGAAALTPVGIVVLCAVALIVAGSMIGYLRTPPIPPGVTVAPRSQRGNAAEADAKRASPADAPQETAAGGRQRAASAD